MTSQNSNVEKTNNQQSYIRKTLKALASILPDRPMWNLGVAAAFVLFGATSMYFGMDYPGLFARWILWVLFVSGIVLQVIGGLLCYWWLERVGDGDWPDFL